jgi:hypothetical protein
MVVWCWQFSSVIRLGIIKELVSLFSLFLFRKDNIKPKCEKVKNEEKQFPPTWCFLKVKNRNFYSDLKNVSLQNPKKI